MPTGLESPIPAFCGRTVRSLSKRGPDISDLVHLWPQLVSSLFEPSV